MDFLFFFPQLFSKSKKFKIIPRHALFPDSRGKKHKNITCPVLSEPQAAHSKLFTQYHLMNLQPTVNTYPTPATYKTMTLNVFYKIL